MIVDINKLEGWLKEKGYKYEKNPLAIEIEVGKGYYGVFTNSYFSIFINTENRKDFKLGRFNKEKGGVNVIFFHHEPEETNDYIEETLPEYLLKILYELQEIRVDYE